MNLIFLKKKKPPSPIITRELSFRRDKPVFLDDCLIVIINTLKKTSRIFTENLADYLARKIYVCFMRAKFYWRRNFFPSILLVQF